MNFASTNYPTKEELRGKGIKSPSKLLSLKYLSQSSLSEQNRNPSSPKCVYFFNSIIILNKEDEAKESAKSSATEYKDHEMTVESEEEFEEESEEETEEEEEDNLEHFDFFPTMKELGLEPRRKPLNPKKICNFVGRARALKVFIGNFTYECVFMVLEDTTSVIDHDLGSVVIFDKKNLGSSLEVSLVILGGQFIQFFMITSKYIGKTRGKKFFKENEKKIFTVTGDDVRIYPDAVVIFDKKNLGSSLEVSLDDSWRTI
ncbi:hypothetical protein Tco_0522918 [Tanacetum coccineum]